MRFIQTANSKVFPYPAIQIWTILTDLSSYSSWWPSSIRIKTLHVSNDIVGSRIEIRPYGGQAFSCEVSNVRDSNELTMKYTGIYSGTGKWTISELNGQSHVTYKIELTINSMLIRLLSSVIPVASLHSRLMEEVLSGLGQYLGRWKGAPNEAL